MPPSPTPHPDIPVRVRRLGEGDSIAALTDLLHRAYRAQVERGLRPLAGRQDEATTRRRCLSGETYVAVLDADEHAKERIVGAILFQEVEEAHFPPHFLRPDVAHFSLFGVEPAHQGRGIGCLLLDHVERRAVELAFAELALSMADPDSGLHRFYEHRGYRFVERWRWPYTNYTSAILSKSMGRG